MSETANPAFSGPPAESGESEVKVAAAELNRLRGLEPALKELQAKYDEITGQHKAGLEAITAKDADLARLNGELEASRKTAGDERAQWESKLADAQKAADAQRAALEARVTEEAGKLGPLRQRFLERAKSEAIASGLAGAQFVGDADAQRRAAAAFRDFLAPQFAATEDGNGEPVIIHRASGRPAAEAMRDLLNAPEYQGFFAAQTRGGAGTDGTGSAAIESPGAYGSLEWLAAAVKRGQAMQHSGLILQPRS